MRFFLSENNKPSIEVDEKLRVVSDFLQGDVQGSLSCANEYLAACNAVKEEKITAWQGTGNAHTVIIKNKTVNVFNEFSEEEIIISFDEFVSYLEAWKSLLLKREAKITNGESL